MALVLDIETAGVSWDTIDQQTQQLLIDREQQQSGAEAETAAKNSLGLSPYTGQVIVIGVLDTETRQGAVYFQNPNQTTTAWVTDGIKFQPMSEAKMLEKFWQLTQKYQTFVTYNGRGFDIPFLNIRSAIHQLTPSKDLMRGRYLYQQTADCRHIDLYDQLTYYNSFRFANGGSLHLACQAFNIVTPKDGVIDGSKVNQYFIDGRHKEIAEYNARDLVATAKLYHFWQTYLAG